MTIIGIDLGTTNSACGVWENDQVKLIPNRLGEILTPSVVGYNDDGNIVVGRIAKERLISHSDKTVACFKRLMGSDHKIRLDKKDFTATELSAIVLRSLKEDAEHHLSTTIDRAVISVPAYFNDNQRHATKLAGELAGLKVDRLINEPTAAAIAYGLHEKTDGTFLVLDMGGGTFDVSLLEFFDGVMEVHASAGDNFLGGEDFVEAMLNDVLSQNNLTRESLSKQQLNQLYMRMETVKRNIDNNSKEALTLLIADKQIEWRPNEDWFNRIATPLLLKAKKPIENTLRDANIPPSTIDDVVLVGGATKMKIFRNTIARMFGRFPSANIDPDVVVAIGSSIQAGLLNQEKALDDIVLTDVCPYTLGTEINGDDGSIGGYFLPIIERNTIVPTSIVRPVQTAHDNQTHVTVNVYQGENRLVEKNIFLGSLEAKVPKGPAGKEAIDIRYSYDMNGLLEIDVTVLSTKKTFSKTIQNSPGSLNSSEIEKTRKKLAKMKFHPRDDEENQALLAQGERLYESSLGEQRDYLSNVLSEFDRILNKQNVLEIKKAQTDLKKLLDELDNEEWI